MSKEFIWLLLSLSISGTLVGGSLFLLKPFTKHFSKAWQYYLWLAVLLRFILPVTGEINLVNQLFFDKSASTEEGLQEKVGQNSVIQQEILISNFDSALSFSGSGEQDDGKDITDQEQDIESKELAAQDRTDKNKFHIPAEKELENKIHSKNRFFIFDLVSYLWIVWLFGAFVLMAVKLTDYLSFLRYLKANNKRVTDQQIQSILDDVMTDLKIKTEVIVFENSLAVSPMLAGVFRPIIILPAGIELSGLRLIFLHELCHYKRRDIWYKWFCQMICCIHWFNPFLLLFKKELNRLCELACDESVMKHLNQQDRKDYGTVLLSTASHGINYKNSVLAMTLIEHKKNLKERLTHIMNFKKMSKFTAACSVAAACLFVTGAVAVGARTVSKSDPIKFPAFISQLPDNIVKPNSIYLEQKDKDKLDWEDWYKNKDKWNWEDWYESFGKEAKDMVQKTDPVYNSNKLIAGEDLSTAWRVQSMVKDMQYFKTERMICNGSETLMIYDVKTPVSVEINYSVNLASGKFKLVFIDPDNHVTTLLEGSGEGKKTISMKKGRNRIKFVSYHSSVTETRFYFSVADKKKLNAMYNSEWEEKEAKYFAEVKAGGKIELKKLVEYAPYMNDTDISDCLVELWKAGEKIPDEVLKIIVTYADTDIIEEYFLGLLKKDKWIEFSILKPIIYCLDEDFLTYYLYYDFEHDKKLTEKQYAELYPYVDSDVVEDHLRELLKKDKWIEFSILEPFFYYLDEDFLADYLRYDFEHGKKLTEKQLSALYPYVDSNVTEDYFRELLKKNKWIEFSVLEPFLYYLDEDFLTDYLQYDYEHERKLTETERSKLYPFIDETLYSKYILKDYANGRITDSELNKVLPYLDEEQIADWIQSLIKSKNKKWLELLNNTVYYLDENDIYDCLNAAAKQKLVSKEELSNFYWFIDKEDFIDLLSEYF